DSSPGSNRRTFGWLWGQLVELLDELREEANEAKGEGKGGKAESKAPPKGNPPKAPCLFFPKGTCTRGENCPFSHETAPGKSSAPKASGAAATAKSSAAAVALTLPTTARGSSVVGSSTPNKTTFWKRSGLSSLFRTIVGWFSVLHNAVPAVLPNESKSTLPVMQTGPYHVEWISDSGAGRILTSLKALSQQGIPSDVMQHVAHSHPVSFATENGVYTSDEVLTSVGQRPFLWLPGELPCFLQSSDCVQYDATGASFAHRVEGNVPIFRESISFGTIADRRLGLAASSSHEPAPSEFEDLFEPPVEGKAEAREIIDDEAPDGKAARLIKEASSVSHRLGHFPKNPYCRICVQARMWGGLAETEAFGDRVAADLVVITKSSKDEKESTVLVVRDEHTGYVRAFPFFRKLTENIVLCLLQFVGSHADKGPTVVFKSDNAKELESACNQMSWIPEPTLPNKWPHNSNLERDIRTIEE
ncbi:unnamed protein product, partial [Symbiodinium microadriaticum]